MAEETHGSGTVETAATPPATAPGQATQQPPEGGAPAGAAPAPGTEGQAPPAAPAAPKSFSQDEVNAIVERRLAKERRRLERELLSRNAPPAAHQPPNAEAAAAQPEAKPQPGNFQDYDAYVEALGAYAARTAYAAERAAQEARTRAERENAARAQFVAGVDSIRAAGMAKWEDFEEVTHDESVSITDHMLAGLVGSKAAPDVLYHLGKHPEEAQTIANMTPAAQIAAMGELRVRLSQGAGTGAAQPSAPASKAPPPVNPVSHSAAAAVDPSKLEGDAYSEWRRARRAKYRSF